ncbi:recombinase family protein [Streptomyces sp. NPDC001833]|uniref:recombinase family protein n=1 Tax=Streptomyces sp. NPDC001833 TaxID=3154658 RepID=UPI0033248E17
MARVLGVVRLSRVSDETTSPERQRRSIQRWADQEGHVVVGWVEDIDVSGGVEPWKRPGFGKWLPSTVGKEVSAIEHRIAVEESRADEYDIICVLKIDRLSRRVLHVHTHRQKEAASRLTASGVGARQRPMRQASAKYQTAWAAGWPPQPEASTTVRPRRGGQEQAQGGRCRAPQAKP